MASLNGIKLKNVKTKTKKYVGRIDMDNKPIGYFSFIYQDNVFSDLFVDINYFTKQMINSLNSDNLFSSNDDLTAALNKDDKNKSEFNRRVDMFCKIPNKEYEAVFCTPDIRDFIKKLFLLYLAEKAKCKKIKKKTKSKKFDVWMGESE